MVTEFKKEEAHIGFINGYVTAPSDYKPDERLPMIVMLHGSGECGNGEDELERVKCYAVAKHFCADPDYKGLRVITASPQCPEGTIWDCITFQLMDWIEAVAEKYNVDRSKISITGLSMGGFGTWDMIASFTDYFYKAAPICGGGVCWRANGKYRDLPIRVFHSTDDDIVPYEYSVMMARNASRFGAKIEFTTYTDKGHGCWDEAYDRTDLIEWLCK